MPWELLERKTGLPIKAGCLDHSLDHQNMDTTHMQNLHGLPEDDQLRNVLRFDIALYEAAKVAVARL